MPLIEYHKIFLEYRVTEQQRNKFINIKNQQAFESTVLINQNDKLYDYHFQILEKGLLTGCLFFNEEDKNITLEMYLETPKLQKFALEIIDIENNLELEFCNISNIIMTLETRKNLIKQANDFFNDKKIDIYINDKNAKTKENKLNILHLAYYKKEYANEKDKYMLFGYNALINIYKDDNDIILPYKICLNICNDNINEVIKHLETLLIHDQYNFLLNLNNCLMEFFVLAINSIIYYKYKNKKRKKSMLYYLFHHKYG